MEADEKELENAPKVTSNDPKERILARRLRIQKRLDVAKNGIASLIPKDWIEVIDEKGQPIPDQVDSSMSKLLQAQEDGRELITNVQVATIAHEVKRKEDDRRNHLEILEMVDEEAKKSEEMFNEITQRWQEIDNLKDPLDIYDATEKQRAKCLELYASKDDLIECLRLELIKLNEEFNSELERQEEDLSTLVDRIDEQVKVMRRVYRTELDLLETAIDVEREGVLKQQTSHFDKLVNNLEDLEKSIAIQKNEIREKCNERYDKAMIEQQDLFRTKKIELMKAFHDMEVGSQNMMALCMLNTEKLNYNYDLLQKRNKENQIIKAQQKRMFTKLQDITNKLEREICNEKEKIAKECERYTVQIVQLHNDLDLAENRANHFAVVNCEKYLSIWDINQKKADQLVKEILNMDRVLYEQQLGIEWIPPKKFRINREDLPSFKEGKRLIAEATKPPEKQKVFSMRPLDSKPDNVGDRLMRVIFDQLSDNLGFLSEEKLKMLIKSFSKDEKVLAELDNVFSTLGIKEVDGIKLMANYFIPYAYCEKCDSRESLQDERAPEEAKKKMSEEGSIESDKLWKSYTPVTGDTSDPRERTFDENINENDDVLEKIATSIHDRFEVMHAVVATELHHDDAKSTAPTEESCAFISTVDQGNTHINNAEDLESLYSICSVSGHKPSINPIYVLKALREFMEDYYTKETLKEDESTYEVISKMNLTVSRYLTEEDVRDFWGRYQLVISEQKEAVWDSLLNGLKNYLSVLKERHNLNEEIKRLKKVNNEMRLLLQNYIAQPYSAKVRNNLMSSMSKTGEEQ